jgi:hypothetical protein
MKKSQFTCSLIIFTFLAACGSSEKQFENLPIVIAQTESQAVDIDKLISNAQEEVQKALPDAYLVFFSFVGQCRNLPKLEGEVRLDFARIQRSLFGDRTFFAESTIDTVDKNLSFQTKDETEHYPNIEPLVLTGKDIQEIVSILHAYLDSKNNCTDTIVLTRVRTESPWRVRCGSPDEVFLECMEIDPATGKITERN